MQDASVSVPTAYIDDDDKIGKRMICKNEISK
jgi:hypothetical protein